jgi:Holliday junction resolvase-like predicted endonuclease
MEKRIEIIENIESVLPLYSVGSAGLLHILNTEKPNKIWKTLDGQTEEILKTTDGNIQEIGLKGEKFVLAYLERKKSEGRILEVIWEAKNNPFSPYDFIVKELDGSLTFIEVKSTTGLFEQLILISYNELVEMQKDCRFHLYRVYKIGEAKAKLRIAENIRDFAQSIVDVFHQLPVGVTPNNISTPLIYFTFTEEEIIRTNKRINDLYP